MRLLLIFPDTEQRRCYSPFGEASRRQAGGPCQKGSRSGYVRRHLILYLIKTQSQPRSYSYTYVEKSIRNGQLEDLNDHAAGPPVGAIRTVGSTTILAKGTRRTFTEDDDQTLWDWVTSCERKGGRISGNEIYKQLEEVVWTSFSPSTLLNMCLLGVESTPSLAILARSMGKDTEFQTTTKTTHGNRQSDEDR